MPPEPTEIARLASPRMLAKIAAAGHTGLPLETPLPNLRDVLKFMEGFGDPEAGKVRGYIEDLLDGARPIA